MSLVPVLAAGVGARRGWGWALRSASFRMDPSMIGRTGLGIAAARPAEAAALVDLLSGQARPACGELQVLGEDLTTAGGRAAVRRHIGIARRNARSRPGVRVRAMVEQGAGLARIPARDRHLLAAAILDRLSLTAWADVPLRAAPDVIARRARLAAAAVHEPALLLIEGLLDDLPPRDAAALADGICELGRDAAIIATGRDARALALSCGEVITLDNGILVSP